VTVDDLRRAQTDVRAPAAWSFRDLIASVDVPPAEGRPSPAARAKELVRAWDGVLSADSAAAAVHEAFVFHLLAHTFRPALGETLFAAYVADARPLFALHEVVTRPADGWLATLGVPLGGPGGLAERALAAAVEELVRRQGDDPGRWRWGALHRITFAHPLGRSVPFGLLDLGPYERPGDDDTLNDAPYDLARPYDLRGHASLRMVVDLADTDDSYSILPTGQSGLVFARHWGDQTPLWLRGELKPMALSRARPDGGVTLTLRAR
jgi:penicillin amidase